MIRMVSCIGERHDPRLVALAVLICVVGSGAVVQLFRRISFGAGVSRIGWIVLAAVGTGTTVWSTHFVAMMAFRPGAPATLDPWMTLASLAAVILLAAPGLMLACRSTGTGPARIGAGLAGGAIIGLAVAIMHYLGMYAYQVHGRVTWNLGEVFLSVLLSVGLAAAAFGMLSERGRGRDIAGALILALSVALLHFTAMAAMTVRQSSSQGNGMSDLSELVLAITTAVAALLVVGCAAVSALIDGHAQSDSYRRLRYMALHDGLTGLPNRFAFGEELDRRLARGESGPAVAVAMLDLSGFKIVNDTHGHVGGDQLLVALSTRLAESVGEHSYVARLGGDEFAVVASYRQPEELTGIMRRLQAVFETPFQFERFSASVGANIGVAYAGRDGWDADSLMLKSDLAMYRAKHAHSPLPCFYDAAMDDMVRARRDMISDLREAIEAGAFKLYFQVQASIADGGITGYEVLVRWFHPRLGPIPPSVFIPLAEETGQIVPLSVWILRQACLQAASWPTPHAVSVNLSPRHLNDPDLVGTVRAALVDSGLPPARLCLELTESAIIHDRRVALDQLEALREMGIAIALDDFGVGYSSLDVLRAFRFDRVKLDGSFVSEIEHDEQAVLLLRGVVALTSMLDMPVLAEGIETEGQLAVVVREGCRIIQGYLIGKPSPVLVDPGHVRQQICTGSLVLQTGQAA